MSFSIQTCNLHNSRFTRSCKCITLTAIEEGRITAMTRDARYMVSSEGPLCLVTSNDKLRVLKSKVYAHTDPD